MKHRQARASQIVLGSALAAMIGIVSGCSGSISDSEGEQSVEGTLQTVIVGNADRSGSHFEYFVEDGRGEWTRLLFDQHPEWLHSEPGHEHILLPGHDHGAPTGEVALRVSGFFEGTALHVVSIETTGELDASSVSEPLIAASPRRTVVILANFASNPSQPITATAARDLVFTGAKSSNAYIQEMSFGIRSLVGKLSTTGDVFGWYTISANPSTCDYSAWGSAARTAAQNAGVNLTGYDHIIHYFPRTSGCGWAGVGQVPGRYTWINGSTAQTISHELGHNFGAHHASSLACTDSIGARVTLGSTCTTNEYGNPFDVMGGGFRHMNAFNKGRVGFLEPENTVNVTTSGTFTVAPLERKSTGIQVLRIPINTTTAYYVEFRQPFGFDNFAPTSAVVNGVLVNRAPISYSTLDRPVLLDMGPNTTSLTDAALLLGGTFTDPATNISLRVNSVSSTGASVTVTRP